MNVRKLREIKWTVCEYVFVLMNPSVFNTSLHFY